MSQKKKKQQSQLPTLSNRNKKRKTNDSKSVQFIDDIDDTPNKKPTNPIEDRLAIVEEQLAFLTHNFKILQTSALMNQFLTEKIQDMLVSFDKNESQPEFVDFSVTKETNHTNFSLPESPQQPEQKQQNKPSIKQKPESKPKTTKDTNETDIPTKPLPSFKPVAPDPEIQNSRFIKSFPYRSASYYNNDYNGYSRYQKQHHNSPYGSQNFNW